MSRLAQQVAQQVRELREKSQARTPRRDRKGRTMDDQEQDRPAEIEPENGTTETTSETSETTAAQTGDDGMAKKKSAKAASRAKLAGTRKPAGTRRPKREPKARVALAPRETPVARAGKQGSLVVIAGGLPLLARGMEALLRQDLTEQDRADAERLLARAKSRL